MTFEVKKKKSEVVASCTIRLPHLPVQELLLITTIWHYINQYPKKRA